MKQRDDAAGSTARNVIRMEEVKPQYTLSNVTIGDFELFCIVVDQGGFREAARYLGLSQSAVSRRIASIEKQLRVELMVRTTRSMKLTEPGRRFLSEARQFAAYSQFLGSITGKSLALFELDLQALNRRAEALMIVHRETELSTMARWFASAEARLLTLVGPGGVGKTALMRLVSLEFNAVRPNGGLWVDLAHVTTVRAALIAVSGKLQIPLTEGDVMGALAEQLQRQGRLLALDNVEQIPGLSKALVELIEQCPALRIMVTSRSALNVRLEHLLAIEPLALPRPQCETIEEAAQAPAFHLFMRRLGASGDSGEQWVSDPKVFRAWLDVLKRTDGLPLAIELIASRARYLPAAQAQALALDHPALTAHDTQDDAIGADRHGSLFACFRSSWVALSAEAQRYLTCIALLVEERFDIEVALELGQAMQLDTPQSQLDALLRACLLERVPGSQDHYRVLVPIREFVLHISRSSPASTAINATTPAPSSTSLYDEVNRLACLWAWHLCQRIKTLQEEKETSQEAFVLRYRFTAAMYATVELDAATHHLSAEQLIGIRDACVHTQFFLNREHAISSMRAARLLLHDSMPTHVQAGLLYNLAQTQAIEGDHRQAEQTVERAHALGADQDRAVAMRRFVAIRRLVLERNDISPSEALTRLKFAMCNAARARLANYCDFKFAHALLLLDGNDPKSAIKHLRHMTVGPFQKGRGLKTHQDSTLLCIALFALTPSKDEWETTRAKLHHYADHHMNIPVKSNNEIIVVSAEMLGFMNGFQPFYAELWRNLSSTTDSSRINITPEQWQVFTVCGIVHFHDGRLKVALEYYEAARKIQSRSPSHPEILSNRALDLLGVKLSEAGA